MAVLSPYTLGKRLHITIEHHHAIHGKISAISMAVCHSYVSQVATRVVTNRPPADSLRTGRRLNHAEAKAKAKAKARR